MCLSQLLMRNDTGYTWVPVFTQYQFQFLKCKVQFIETIDNKKETAPWGRDPFNVAFCAGPVLWYHVHQAALSRDLSHAEIKTLSKPLLTETARCPIHQCLSHQGRFPSSSSPLQHHCLGLSGFRHRHQTNAPTVLHLPEQIYRGTLQVLQANPSYPWHANPLLYLNSVFHSITQVRMEQERKRHMIKTNSVTLSVKNVGLGARSKVSRGSWVRLRM